jgi:hypothetical protein
MRRSRLVSKVLFRSIPVVAAILAFVIGDPALELVALVIAVVALIVDTMADLRQHGPRAM